VDPPAVDLPAGGRAGATVTVTVPTNAVEGERYAAIWAELPPVTPDPGGQGVTLVNRVGVRVYLFVGPGGAPPSDFAVDSLVAARNRDGRPVVNALVHNTGRRALDLGGELRLNDGPGGLTAGPFRAQSVTTLQVGETGTVAVELDARIPLGPWEATMTLRSGNVERQTRARVSFPEANEAASPPAKAEEVVEEDDDLPAGLIVGGAALLGALVGLLLSRRRRRRATSS
jgi:MYXO-CTERM domain-containing protein